MAPAACFSDTDKAIDMEFAYAIIPPRPVTLLYELFQKHLTSSFALDVHKKGSISRDIDVSTQ
jgi:hypothetical protein